MEDEQRILFGGFPRPVAASGQRSPHQFFVHSEGEFDAFFNVAGMKKNTYASVSRFPVGKPPVTDKVSFDLDSPMKEAAFPDEVNDQEKLNRMREDSEVAIDVLGDVCEDARRLSKFAQEKDVPVIGVYSGMGIHIHFLFEAEENAGDKFKSTLYKFADELDLSTVDFVAKDISRILRIPNGRRVDVEDGQEIICDIFTVPMHRSELLDVTPEDLLEISTGPRHLDMDLVTEQRPSMPLYEDYVDDNGGQVHTKDIEEARDVGNAETEFILDSRIDMPCIAERAKQKHPDHYVRFALATSLFNNGYNVVEATDFIASLSWDNFERDKTKEYLRGIYEKGYSRPGCDTMKSSGYCVYPDEPTECDCYGCPSERCKWS